MDYSPWGHKELDMTEQRSNNSNAFYSRVWLLLIWAYCIKIVEKYLLPEWSTLGKEKKLEAVGSVIFFQ